MKEYKKQAKEYGIIVKEKSETFNSAKITSSQDAVKYMRNFFNNIEIYESFYILCLNRAKNIIGWVCISQGGTSSTVVDLKLIAKYAIDLLSDAVIIAHNHPSGNKIPSDADIALTKRVKEGLKIFDITLLDHTILTEDSYYSLADEGQI